MTLYTNPLLRAIFAQARARPAAIALQEPGRRGVTYGEIARQIGRPAASRAVGAANGRNPISIIAPCHRVIGSNGGLTGFAGGLPAKERLLGLESGRLAL